MKVDVKATWTSVTDALPPDDRLVETKIASESMGDWCLIKRRYRDGKWLDEKHAWDDRPPTHWHFI